MNMVNDSAEQLKNDSIVLNLNGRINDALNKICGAISINPSKAEYHLHRGIFYKRLKNYDNAIDEFFLGLDKIDHLPNSDSMLFDNFQRQILLTYNEFAMHCFNKRFYAEAIILLNKAIKIEKNEKGLYINRGGYSVFSFVLKIKPKLSLTLDLKFEDAFYKQQDYDYSILDYEQALELNPKDVNITLRIAKIYYQLAIQAYDKKDYFVSTNKVNWMLLGRPIDNEP